MQSRTVKPFRIGTKTRVRFPRTNDLKRAGRLLRSPNRPPKFDSWLRQPLACFVGRFRRLRREMVTKPVRADYIQSQLVKGDAALMKALSDG